MDMERWKPSEVTNGTIRGTPAVENSCGSSTSYIENYHVTSNSAPGYIPKRIKNTCAPKNLYTNVHGAVIRNGQKVETTCVHQQIYR